MQDFEGKVAVVTGAGSGIGRALAHRFAALGSKVVLADVETAALDVVAAELAEEGASALAVQTDVTQADSVSALAERTLSEFGGVHILCNNAGVFTGGLSWQQPLSDYEWVLNVNVWGVLHGIRTFVPIMLGQSEPAYIVNTASMAGVTSSPLSGAYYMSKHAVLSISETLYLELQGREPHIGVSALCPEIINTGIGRSGRNRPEHLKRKAGEGDTPERAMVEEGIASLAPQGLDPAEIAKRVERGMRDERFYILSEEGESWRDASNTRCEDIRLARNPTLVTPSMPES